MTHVLVTGGGGFVGGNFARMALQERPDWAVTVFDCLPDPERVPVLRGLRERFPGRFRYVKGRVTDGEALAELFSAPPFTFVVHFAAKNPSGRMEADPTTFVQVNVLGTAMLLECVRQTGGPRARFLHLSSYEVYGSGVSGIFTEESPLNPSTPYAASKAAADELTLAYHRTYGLDALVTRTTNIYGPFQSQDKLIPAIVALAKEGAELPVYGSGANLRDWIHVDDHNRGVLLALEKGRPGQVYHLGSRCERSNIEVVRGTSRCVAEFMDRRPGEMESRIKFVEDREGHDARRALDPGKSERELGFSPRVAFEKGLESTVRWILEASSLEFRSQGGEAKR